MWGALEQNKPGLLLSSGQEMEHDDVSCSVIGLMLAPELITEVFQFESDDKQWQQTNIFSYLGMRHTSSK